MIIEFHKKFRKAFRKLKAGEIAQLKERLELFSKDPFNQKLNNHRLQGEYSDRRSINITGDLRALYKIKSRDTVLFVLLDTHSELYE